MVIFEAKAKVVLSKATNEPYVVSSPKSFGFIITVNGESFSSAVISNGAGCFVPGREAEVCLRFLVPEVASKAIYPGLEFTFFEEQHTGAGYVVSVRNA